MCVILNVNHHSYMMTVSFFPSVTKSTNLSLWTSLWDGEMLAEYLGNAEAWSFSDMDVIQPGEKVFQSFHVSKLTGSAPREVKEIINSIYNSDQDTLLENIKSIEKKFDLKYFGRLVSLYSHKIAFINKKSEKPVIYKATRVKDSSLLGLTALKVSSQLGDKADIASLIEEGLIPAQLSGVLLKHL